MVKFRFLLLFVGVCGVILETDSYTYPGAAEAYSAPESSPYGYMSYGQPLYSSYSQPSYGSYGKPYNPSYATCANAKVIQVLDEIFCQHVHKKTFSSTILPVLKMLTKELEWIQWFIIIEDAWDAIGDALLELTTLEDELYSNYMDSYLLRGYLEGVQSSGAASVSSTTEDAKTAATNKMEAKKTNLAQIKDRATTFKNANSVDFTKSKNGQAINTKQQAATAADQKVNTVSKASGVAARKRSAANAGFVLAQEQTKRLNHTRGSRSTIPGSRRSRNTRSTSDYTCSYLQPTYCSEDKYDELLYNTLDRLFDALFYIFEALIITFEYIDDIDCGASPSDEQAVVESAISAGSMLPLYFTTLYIADEVYNMYLISELEDVDPGYRASEKDDIYVSPVQQPSDIAIPIAPYAYRPSMMPSYPYSGYTSQPAQAFSYYSSPARYRRGTFSVVPHTFG